MKNAILKNSINVVAALLAFAISSESLAQEKSLPTTATLISRYTVGNYHTATYSFRYGGQGDLVPSLNNWEILFEGYGTKHGGQDEFRVNTVTDDTSSIFDLGPGFCENITDLDVSTGRKGAGITLRRAGKPISLGQHNAQESVPVIAQHCYMTVNQDSKGVIISRFHVQSHVPGYKVDLNEIQVILDLPRN